MDASSSLYVEKKIETPIKMLSLSYLWQQLLANGSSIVLVTLHLADVVRS